MQDLNQSESLFNGKKNCCKKIKTNSQEQAKQDDPASNIQDDLASNIQNGIAINIPLQTSLDSNPSHDELVETEPTFFILSSETKGTGDSTNNNAGPKPYKEMTQEELRETLACIEQQNQLCMLQQQMQGISLGKSKPSRSIPRSSKSLPFWSNVPIIKIDKKPELPVQFSGDIRSSPNPGEMIGKFSINTCLGANISSLQQPDIDQVQLTKTSSQQDETGKNTVINSRSLAVNEIKYSRSFFPQGTQLLFTPQTAVDTTLKNLQQTTQGKICTDLNAGRNIMHTVEKKSQQDQMQLINKNTAAQKSTQINANNQSDFQIILKNNLLKQQLRSSESAVTFWKNSRTNAIVNTQSNTLLQTTPNYNILQNTNNTPSMSYNQQIPSISYNQQISPMNYQQQIPTTNHHVVQQANSMPQSLPLQQHFPVHHNHNSYILPQISLQLECPSLDSNTLLQNYLTNKSMAYPDTPDRESLASLQRDLTLIKLFQQNNQSEQALRYALKRQKLQQQNNFFFQQQHVSSDEHNCVYIAQQPLNNIAEVSQMSFEQFIKHCHNYMFNIVFELYSVLQSNSANSQIPGKIAVLSKAIKSQTWKIGKVFEQVQQQQQQMEHILQSIEQWVQPKDRKHQLASAYSDLDKCKQAVQHTNKQLQTFQGGFQGSQEQTIMENANTIYNILTGIVAQCEEMWLRTEMCLRAEMLAHLE